MEQLPVLNAEEQRVLGALMEKSKTTPDYYPMTLNGLTAACNQKSSRKPVVDYDEETVMETLNSLRKKGLVATATGGSSRAIKYKHNFTIVFPLLPEECAVICLLLLRGPLTPGEINSNAGRLYDFDDLEEVQAKLEKLSEGDTPFVAQLPRRAGQKEIRWAHLLGGKPGVYEEDAVEEPVVKSSTASLELRLAKVEEEIAEMKTAFDKLMKELMG